MNILSEDADVTEENIDKVVNATWFYMDMILPTYVVKNTVENKKFQVEVYS